MDRAFRAAKRAAAEERTPKKRKRGESLPGTPAQSEEPAARAASPASPPRKRQLFANAVQLSRHVKLLYAYNNLRTALTCGLTSDYDVSGPRRRRQDDTPVAPQLRGPKDLNTASEGYGEMSAGSIERLLRHLSRLDKQAAAADIKHTVRLNGLHALGPKSGFIDVGSGSGKVSMHAALFGEGVAFADGVEYVAGRASAASEVLAEVAAALGGDLWRCGAAGAALTALAAAAPPDAAQRLARCTLRHGDATADAGVLRASHVYMYDKVFSDATSAALAKRLSKARNACAARVLVSYRRPESWRKLGLAKSWQLVGRCTMKTTGDQNFTAYIMAR